MTPRTPDAGFTGHLSDVTGAPAVPLRRQLRPHRPAVLRTLGGALGGIPLDVLNAEGVQARAWLILLEQHRRAPGDAETRTLVGFYCSTFDVDAEEVERDLHAFDAGSAPAMPTLPSVPAESV